MTCRSRPCEPSSRARSLPMTCQSRPTCTWVDAVLFLFFSMAAHSFRRCRLCPSTCCDFCVVGHVRLFLRQQKHFAVRDSDCLFLCEVTPYCRLQSGVLISKLYTCDTFNTSVTSFRCTPQTTARNDMNNTNCGPVAFFSAVSGATQPLHVSALWDCTT